MAQVPSKNIPECLRIPRARILGFCLCIPAFLDEIIFRILALQHSCFAFLRRRGGGEAHSGGASTGRGLFSSERRSQWEGGEKGRGHDERLILIACSIMWNGTNFAWRVPCFYAVFLCEHIFFFSCEQSCVCVCTVCGKILCTLCFDNYIINIITL